ncbi:hypothetical protein L208DRAFT_1518703, partial [Tricholoma matsutake]
QVITIDGKHHVDNNNDFGNRGAGHLWVTFFSLILWIAIYIKFISDLFSYVDDSYSWDFAERMEFYGPYGKMFPSKQTHLLSLFDELGVPHEECKQVFGSQLTIIGFDVDPNAMMITMPFEARQDLLAVIHAFANPNQHQSLKDFQHLAGWVNWSLNVYPLLCPSLSSVYEKMCRGSSPFQKLFINNAICSELHWLTDHIEHSDGVHIIESWEWSRSDAHDMYLSDACPSGMGYWLLRTHEGFQCAIPRNTRNTASSSLKLYQFYQLFIMYASTLLQNLVVLQFSPIALILLTCLTLCMPYQLTIPSLSQLSIFW